MYPKAFDYRKSAKATDTEIDRLTILHINNKFNILQNNQSAEEIQKVSDINAKWCQYKVKEKILQ